MEVDGVIRCRGRYENAPLDYNAKYPIFLPKSHQFTELVVLYCHDLVIHDSVKETLNEICSKFWIPKVRNFIKTTNTNMLLMSLLRREKLSISHISCVTKI